MSFVDRLISSIAPHDCLGCGYEGSIICVQCAQTFEKVPERCYRCRKVSPQSRTCVACRRASRLGRVFVATVYDDLAKDLVWQLKFHGAQAAAVQMAERMADLLARDSEALLVPIPTATGRARHRGYDQAKLLARELSRRSVFLYFDCLRRSGQTHQVGASRQERLKQLEAAYRVKTGVTLPQRVILVDDVVTTGATLEAAATALKCAGARSVDAIVFAQA